MHEEYGLKSNSAEMQDIAAALLLGSNKKFLDIGARLSMVSSQLHSEEVAQLIQKTCFK